MPLIATRGRAQLECPPTGKRVRRHICRMNHVATWKNHKPQKVLWLLKKYQVHERVHPQTKVGPFLSRRLIGTGWIKNRSWGSTSENLEAWATVGEFLSPNSAPSSRAPFPLARRSCREDLTLRACARALVNVEARGHGKCLSRFLSTLFFKAGSIHEPGVHEFCYLDG